MSVVAQTVNLNHIYPGTSVNALKDINLTLEKGVRVAIVGQNGSGKTTLSKHFNGLLRPTSGSVTINGVDAASKTTGELSQLVGYVFQNPNYQLFSNTVKDEIEFGLKNMQLKPDEMKTRLTETLDFFDLKELADKQPLSFSSGVRKTVALASVYAMRPPILFLDEPTTGQDHPGKERIGQMVLKMAAEGHTVIIITHDMNFVMRFTERVIVMAQGEIIKDATPREIFCDNAAMEKAHLSPPQVFSLAARLDCLGIPADTASPKEMAETLAQRRARS